MLVPLKGYGVNAPADLQVGELAVVVAGNGGGKSPHT